MQGTYDNSKPTRDGGGKWYEYSGSHFFLDCPWIQLSNSSGHGGHVEYDWSGNGNGRVNGDRGRGRNGDISNITYDIHGGNHKPMSAFKYIHPIDDNTVVEISGTTLKFYKHSVWYFTFNDGFIISTTLPMNILIMFLKHTLVSTNITTPPLRKATLIHLQILPAIAKGVKQVMRIRMIFDVVMSTALWLLIQLIILTVEELSPFDLPLNMHH